LDSIGDSIEAFYHRLGMVLLGSVTDNDCGVDLMTMMLDLPQNFAERRALRNDLSDYLLQRLEVSWMHDMMLACGELSYADVEQARSRGLIAASRGTMVISDANGPDHDATPHASIVIDDTEGPEVEAPIHVIDPTHLALFPEDFEVDSDDDTPGATPTQPSEPAVVSAQPPGPSQLAGKGAEQPRAADLALVPASAEETLEALAWATGTKDKSVLLTLQDNLPPWSIQEQVRLYQAREPAVKKGDGTQSLVVRPTLLHGRHAVAIAFHRHLKLHQQVTTMRGRGQQPAVAGRGSYAVLPKHVWQSFLQKLQWEKSVAEKSTQYKRDCILKWYRAWQEQGGTDITMRIDQTTKNIGMTEF